MPCPFCGSDATKVFDSRPDAGGRLRKRRCGECGQAFGTVERITADSLKVRKRDGRMQEFSRPKLVRAITKSAHLYALPPADVDAFVDRVVGRLQPGAPGVPIPSTEIGRQVLQALQDSRTVTDVARIRYALVFFRQRGRFAGQLGFHDFLQWLEEAYGSPDAEPPATTPWRVIKRDGGVEPFDVGKLERSLGIALKGRSSSERVRELAAHIAFDVGHELRGQALVTSQQIAAEVVKLLLKRDRIAYLRYGSVMKRYRSVGDFWIDALVLPGEDEAHA